METEFQYECSRCGRKLPAGEDNSAPAPECCGQPMTWGEKLPACGVTPTAEHSRMDDMGEPCDDGRSGG